MRKIHREEEYFHQKDKEAFSRVTARKKSVPRPSPITGKPMEHLQVNGVTVDRCKDTGGIWLDAGELEQIINAAKKLDKTTGQRWLKKFFNGLVE